MHHLPHIQTWAWGGFFIVSTHSPPLPPLSHLNMSWRWSFLLFWCISHHHHLPCIQMWARGGFFIGFYVSPTTTTSLASKCKPEVVLFIISTQLPPPPPLSHPNVSQRWFFSSVLMHLPAPSSLSYPNVSQRWFFFWQFQHDSHHWGTQGRRCKGWRRLACR